MPSLLSSSSCYHRQKGTTHRVARHHISCQRTRAFCVATVRFDSPRAQRQRKVRSSSSFSSPGACWVVNGWLAAAGGLLPSCLYTLYAFCSILCLLLLIARYSVIFVFSCVPGMRSSTSFQIIDQLCGSDRHLLETAFFSAVHLQIGWFSTWFSHRKLSVWYKSSFMLYTHGTYIYRQCVIEAVRVIPPSA